MMLLEVQLQIGGDHEQFFVHIPKQKQEWHNHNPVMVQPKMPNQN